MFDLKRIVASFLLVIGMNQVFAQNQDALKNIDDNHQKVGFFVAYELAEMAFNNFQNFSGEVGVAFKNDHQLRFVYQNVKLSESHLSSNFSKAVDGKNISGLMETYELFYDIKVYSTNSNNMLYWGLSTGYAEDYYQHTLLEDYVRNTTWTVGFAPSFRETNLFKVKGLYYKLAVPFRYYFDPLEKTNLGNSTVKKHIFTNNIWFFVGYQF